MSTRWVEVAAGAILSSDGESVLLAKRKPDQHQGNLWEFPGGKIEAGETPQRALVRELNEELGIHAERVHELIVTEHEYSDKSVRLHVFTVTSFRGEPQGAEGQELRWVRLDELQDYDFPAANAAIVEALQPESDT